MSVSVSVTARRLAAATLAAGALTAAVAVPASAADHARPHWDRVEISAVQYDSPGRDHRSNRSVNREWVDITNNSRHDVNLDGWTLSDDKGHTYTFHHYRLEGRATVRVHTGYGHDTNTDLYPDRRTYVLDDYNGSATLRNDHGRFIDEYTWSTHHHRDGNRHHDGRHTDMRR